MRVTLTVLAGPHQGRVFTFSGHDTFLVGRSKHAHFKLSDDDPYLSRIHFMVEVNPPWCRLVDLGSRNRTRVNGQPVDRAELKSGDVIRAGQTIFKVAVEEADELPRLEDSLASRSVAPLPSVVRDLAPLPSPPRPPGERDPAATPAAIDLGPDWCRVCYQPSRHHGPWTTAGGQPIPLCADCRQAIDARPQPIAGYLLARQLGQGGMGIVWQALRLADATVYALKMISPVVAARQDELERFHREVRILAALNHPHIVGLRDSGECDGKLYFAMDYVRGSDARRLVKEGGPLAVCRAVGLISQVLQALEYAHGKGFVHRDLKPSNVFLVEGAVKLIDFGLAVDLAAGQPSAAELPAGTVSYLAPEQAMGGPVDARTDVYALGTLAYELLTGVNPGQGAYRPVDELAPGVTAALEIVLAKARAREPAQRYATVEAFCEAWTAVVPTQPASQAAPLWRRTLSWLQTGLRTAVSRYWPVWLALILLLGLAYPAPIFRLGLLLALALMAVLLTDWYSLWLGRRSGDPLLPAYGPLIGLLLAVALWLPPTTVLAAGDISAGGPLFLDYVFILVIHLAVALAFGSLALLALGLGMAAGRRLGLRGAGRMVLGLGLAGVPLALHALFYLANF